MGVSQAPAESAKAVAPGHRRLTGLGQPSVSNAEWLSKSGLIREWIETQY